MKNRIFSKVTGLFLLGITLFTSCGSDQSQQNSQPKASPNIIFIYLDDLGYGDVSAYGVGTLSTPNMDRLANGGIRFTNGYASSATCTPSRFALLTGMYPWRNADAKILSGTAPLLIDTAQLTIPKLLKEQGYHTGIVGKWHLGLGTGSVDWNQEISPGPNQVGFDYSHILAATQDRVPTVYIDNGRVLNLDPNDPIMVNYDENFEGEPTALTHPELLTMKWHHGHNNSIVNGIPRIGFMKGGEKAKWSDIDMADHFLGKAKTYVQDRVKAGEPFFLFYALQEPHVPRTPHPRFEGTSGMGPRGDAILEADWVVGELLKELEEQGILENTLIFFSSDNGPVLNDGYYDDAVEKIGNHTPAGPLRGGKYSLFEAGTRVPFITYWKGTIQPGVSDALVTQIDLLASLAALTGSEKTAADSENLIDVLMGKSQKGREAFVLEATTKTALRAGDWLMIPPYNGLEVAAQVNIELGNSPEYQLYNLKEDIGQTKNLAQTNPEKLQEMISIFEGIRGPNDKQIQQLELK
ncbi:arylsulfatase A-like enzyme [Algoriphagus boseongensis]|uniref:Arylsulfatase A-like enzyme n=1 Tax=Algoriphagus boseongensis TaxID=1442587 RepID=A0A4R6T4F6_9BACT|nr:arylsulfatase [Algoriphagus boseongensis]TDQ15215.1 arylsulfatase A-like enzyme [Algoriphagus boseongensis]